MGDQDDGGVLRARQGEELLQYGGWHWHCRGTRSARPRRRRPAGAPGPVRRRRAGSAAGHLRRAALPQFAESRDGARTSSAAASAGPCAPGQAQRQGGVLLDGQLGEQLAVLEDETEAFTAQRADLVVGEIAERPSPRTAPAPRVAGSTPGKAVQQRGLPRTALPGDRRDLPRRDREMGVTDGWLRCRRRGRLLWPTRTSDVLIGFPQGSEHGPRGRPGPAVWQVCRLPLVVLGGRAVVRVERALVTADAYVGVVGVAAAPSQLELIKPRRSSSACRCSGSSRSPRPAPACRRCARHRWSVSLKLALPLEGAVVLARGAKRVLAPRGGCAPVVSVGMCATRRRAVPAPGDEAAARRRLPFTHVSPVCVLLCGSAGQGRAAVKVTTG